jgi:hypothetical protein
LTQLSHYRDTALIAESVKVCAREMSGLSRTATPGKEPQVLNRRGSSRVVLLAKKFWELVPAGEIFGLVLATLLVVGASASAADLTGRVTNGTTKKPAAGDEVVLLTLAQAGMSESARAKTDNAGHFTLAVADTQASRLVRVVHQGVTYHKMAEPGVKSIAVEVYDITEKVEDVTVTAVMDVQRFEATNETLEVKQLITMRNASKPPRTLMNDRPFEIQLPPEAQVESGLVQIGDGQPLKQRPMAGDQKGQYYFLSPLRPGDTRFAVVYKLPYNGEALMEPRIRNPLERFVVMLPKSMKFEPKAAGIFQPMPDTTPDNVQGTAPVTSGQTLAFRISGMGTLAELQGRRQEAKESEAAQKARPGGGLGPPIEAPDPLHEHRGQILAGLAVLLVAGAVYVVRKTRVPLAGRDQSAPWQVPTRSLKQQVPICSKDRHRRRVRAH